MMSRAPHRPGGKVVDEAVNPKHYSDLGIFAAVFVVEKWKLGYLLGQTVKYIQRAGSKPGESELRDLKKAQWYLARRIHELDPTEPDPASWAEHFQKFVDGG